MVMMMVIVMVMVVRVTVMGDNDEDDEDDDGYDDHDSHDGHGDHDGHVHHHHDEDNSDYDWCWMAASITTLEPRQPCRMVGVAFKFVASWVSLQAKASSERAPCPRSVPDSRLPFCSPRKMHPSGSLVQDLILVMVIVQDDTEQIFCLMQLTGHV